MHLLHPHLLNSLPLCSFSRPRWCPDFRISLLFLRNYIARSSWSCPGFLNTPSKPKFFHPLRDLSSDSEWLSITDLLGIYYHSGEFEVRSVSLPEFFASHRDKSRTGFEEANQIIEYFNAVFHWAGSHEPAESILDFGIVFFDLDDGFLGGLGLDFIRGVQHWLDITKDSSLEEGGPCLTVGLLRHLVWQLLEEGKRVVQYYFHV